MHLNLLRTPHRNSKRPIPPRFPNNTPIILHFDILILQLRPSTNIHSNIPPRILLLIIKRRKRNRLRRIPVPEFGNRAGNENGFAKGGAVCDVELDGDGGDGCAGRGGRGYCGFYVGAGC